MATLTSRVLGLVREQVLASTFGAGNEMDAFLVAFRIPNFVRDLFAEGAMSAAFVPTFTRHLTQQGKASAWRLSNSVLNALLIATGALVLLGMAFARPIVAAYAPDFARVPGKIELTIRLTHIVLPFLTLAAVAAAAMGMLNSLRHYFVPTLAPATFNVVTILSMLVVAPFALPGVTAIMVLAVATLVGGVAQVAVQWPALRREGFRYAPTLDVKDAGLRQILALMGPGILGLAATQVNLLVTTQIATSQGPGAVSWLQYAFRLMYLPIGLFGVSIATAVLPAVSRQVASANRPAMSDTVSRGIGMMLAVNIPASIGLMVLAPELVQLLFERGRFQPADTAATAAALRCYAVGLVGYSTARIAAPVFYALGQSRVAVAVSTVTIVLNALLCLLLVSVMGFAGLALATALCAIVNGGALLVLLARRLGPFDVSSMRATLLRSVVASMAMGGVALWTSTAMHRLMPEAHLASEGTRVFAAITAGLVTLLIAGRLLHIREFDQLFDEARRRLSLASR